MVVTFAKFAEGAWVTALLIPTMMIVMIAIRRHYRHIEAEVVNPAPLDLSDLRAPLVVVPILAGNRIAQKGLRFALSLSSEVQALHIDCEKDSGDFCQTWDRYVEGPAKRAGLVAPHLVELQPAKLLPLPIVRLGRDLRIPAGLRRRLAVGNLHFDLPEQIHNLPRLLPLR